MAKNIAVILRIAIKHIFDNILPIFYSHNPKHFFPIVIVIYPNSALIFSCLLVGFLEITQIMMYTI